MGLNFSTRARHLLRLRLYHFTYTWVDLSSFISIRAVWLCGWKKKKKKRERRGERERERESERKKACRCHTCFLLKSLTVDWVIVYEGNLAGRCVQPQWSTRLEADGLYQGANNIGEREAWLKQQAAALQRLEVGTAWKLPGTTTPQNGNSQAQANSSKTNLIKPSGWSNWPSYATTLKPSWLLMNPSPLLLAGAYIRNTQL